MEVYQTEAFKDWHEKLKDHKAKLAITAKITRVENGNLGNYRDLGGGLAEFKINIGKGYRLYHVRKGNIFIFLLHGGTKHRQDPDITKARILVEELEETLKGSKDGTKIK